MIRQGPSSNKRFLGRSSIVIASFGFFEKIFNPPDLLDALRQTTKSAGISLEEINITALAESLSSSTSLAEMFDRPNHEMNVLAPSNLIEAIVNVRRALLTESDYNFGLAIYVQPKSTFGPTSISLMILKKTDYFQATQWLPENIICSVINSNETNISETTIKKANKDLEKYQEPAITNFNAIVKVTEDNAHSTLETFFSELTKKDQLVMLVWDHGHTESSILIRT
ncbi:MAG: hypothetical protein WCV58_03365 [Patescibacteria group bacterium]|jgi:hypothetical protein